VDVVGSERSGATHIPAPSFRPATTSLMHYLSVSTGYECRK